MCCMDPALDVSSSRHFHRLGPLLASEGVAVGCMAGVPFRGHSNHLLEHQGMMCLIQISAGKPTIPAGLGKNVKMRNNSSSGWPFQSTRGPFSSWRILWVHPLKSHIYASTWDIVQAGRHQAEAREIAAPRKLALGGPSFGLHSKPVATVCLKEASKGCLVFGRGTV